MSTHSAPRFREVPSVTLEPPRLVSVATATPPHRVDQENVRAFVAALFATVLEGDGDRLLQVFDNSGIESRNLCMPLSWYGDPHDFEEKNALYVEHGLALATEVSEGALVAADLQAQDVDHVVFVSSSGIATPSLDARLANLLGFRRDVRRTPVWGLGCAGGAAGLALARDFAVADPEACVLLVSLELCSLTFQHGDRDRRNLVATALFSDGAAAAIVRGARSGVGTVGPGGRVELAASRSTTWPDTLDVMGWTVDGQGLHVVFSRDIPSIVRRRVRPSLEDFLAGLGLDFGTMTHVVAHPGGPKVLAAYAESLGLPSAAFHHARDILRSYGNMSSPTCLFVLERLLANEGIEPGETAVVTALGPGFSAEYVLLRGAS